MERNPGYAFVLVGFILIMLMAVNMPNATISCNSFGESENVAQDLLYRPWCFGPSNSIWEP